MMELHESGTPQIQFFTSKQGTEQKLSVSAIRTWFRPYLVRVFVIVKYCKKSFKLN